MRKIAQNPFSFILFLLFFDLFPRPRREQLRTKPVTFRYLVELGGRQSLVQASLQLLEGPNPHLLSGGNLVKMGKSGRQAQKTGKRAERGGRDKKSAKKLSLLLNTMWQCTVAIRSNNRKFSDLQSLHTATVALIEAQHPCRTRAFKTLHSAARSAAQPDPETALSEFESWLEVNGVELGNSRLAAVGDGAGNGVVAMQPCVAGDRVAEVPRNIALTAVCSSRDPKADAAWKQLFALLANDDQLKGDPSIVLAMRLLFEQVRGAESFFAPYISILPATLESALFLNPSDFRQLEGSPVLPGCIQNILATVQAYIHIKTLLEKQQKSFAAADLNGLVPPYLQLLSPEIFAFEDFRWAVAVVLSRQNIIPVSAPLSRKKTPSTKKPTAAKPTSSRHGLGIMRKYGTKAKLKPKAPQKAHVPGSDPGCTQSCCAQPQGVALVPGLDMFNHQSRAVASQNDGKQDALIMYNREKDSFVVAAMQATEAGGELFMDYGMDSIHCFGDRRIVLEVERMEIGTHGQP